MPEEIQSMNYASPAMPMMKSEKADILDKIAPEEIVELIRNRLMGKMQDDRTGMWITIDVLKDNAISEQGAWDLSTLILSVSNKNVSISKLSDKEIRRRAFSIMKTSIKMMIANWKSYIIKNSAQLYYIADIVFSVSFITMKQCDAEGIRKMIMGTRQESHQVAEYGEAKKRGLFRSRL